MRLIWALVGLRALVFIIAAPWKSGTQAGYTELTAKDQAEKIFRPFLARGEAEENRFRHPRRGADKRRRARELQVDINLGGSGLDYSR